MNKQEAYQEMFSSQMITNSYFMNDEYLCYNFDKDQIVTEEGYLFDRFWDNDYLANVEWEIFKN